MKLYIQTEDMGIPAIFAGKTVQEHVSAFLMECGVSKEELDQLKNVTVIARKGSI